MERILRIGAAMRSAVGAVAAARPLIGTDGVDISTWATIGGNRVPPDFMVYLIGDGTSTGVGNPTGGTGGPEVWAYIADNAGTARWCLVAFLNNRTVITLPATAVAGGYAEIVRSAGVLAQRIAIAGAPGTGGGVGFFVEGIEREPGVGI